MGQRVSKTDFEHSYTDEPHATRRKEILKIHPEIKTLFGPDPMLVFWITLLVIFQVSSLFVVFKLTWMQTVVMAYCVGGTFNHSLFLGIHENAHNLAFGYRYPIATKILGIFCNLPLGIPASTKFRPYHLNHHKFQGDTMLDTDLPTKIEGELFCTTFGKLIWMILQPLFYLIRPLSVDPQPVSLWDVINFSVQMAYNAVIWYFFNFRTFAYMVISSLLTMGLHPMAGHFIAEHYMFVQGRETYSYYGPLNYLAFNVGYHNEHHDFPFVPFSRLPKVRAMAPEFYDSLPQHKSWVGVIYRFITDPSIGPYSRVVRAARAAKPLEATR